MCQGPMHEFLKALPKCEHHMHLEGSLEPSLLFSLASLNKIPLPTTDTAFTSPETLLRRYRAFTSLDDFLHYYFIGMSVLITSSDFEALATAYFERAHADGVLHAEVFFDPQAHTSRGVRYEDVVDGFRAAQEKARQKWGLTSELIVCVLRHLPVEDGMAMYRAAIPDLEAGRVKGLGLSSTELGNPPGKYKAIFDDAVARGFNRTAHAGEEAGVEYMASALHDLHVTRVDHGIKLTQDPAVLKEFVDAKILITMCPLSNVELRCIPSIADLPIRKYLDEGVRFSINSDDPAYFGGYILDNYCAVQDTFGLEKKEWEVVVRNSIEGSWCAEERKREILKVLEEVMGR
ncbi:adenine deaminase [Cladophialophora chaetospira]|uniref:Adenine deaminase n=1 Tax=Cladophialophora chaetospira TaxID=386627 RepID=A0AA38XMP2_9EURO|nr:adenine deaminase [Cladophialophora chaetospira]